LIGESSYAQSLALESYGWDGCCEPPEHDADHVETNEGSDGSGVVLEITRHAAITVNPGTGSVNDPSFGQGLESYYAPKGRLVIRFRSTRINWLL
jgi:hypothetical protein